MNVCSINKSKRKVLIKRWKKNKCKKERGERRFEKRSSKNKDTSKNMESKGGLERERERREREREGERENKNERSNLKAKGILIFCPENASRRLEVG
jgi:hypothetical protein